MIGAGFLFKCSVGVKFGQISVCFNGENRVWHKMGVN